LKRRDLVKNLLLTGAFAGLSPRAFAAAFGEFENELKKSNFGKDFKWGVATAAYQIEGAWDADGKGPGIWDTFTQNQPKKIKDHSNGNIACDFYHRYEEDIQNIKKLNFQANRFSLSWPRILPAGIGTKNQKGIDFYHRVIDYTLQSGLEPWVTLYHWDLPQALQDKGGWTNRESINWFSEYVDLCSREFGDKVKNWMVFNEPMAFTALGYLSGTHAPGIKGIGNFKKAVHHVVLCQAEGGRILKANVKNGHIGSTFSCSHIQPINQKPQNIKAAARMDAMLNRLFIEPVLGLGYPKDAFHYLESMEKLYQPGDESKMKFDFDFIGIQNYFRVVSKHSAWPPLMWATQVKPKKLVANESELTSMGWEVYPDGIYEVIKKFSAYKGVKKIYITENGCAFPDEMVNGEINDTRRIEYFKSYLSKVLKAKNEGFPVNGYFVWSLMDNFEWAEGFEPRFGLVHVDFQSQKRTIKKSGLWFQDFLK